MVDIFISTASFSINMVLTKQYGWWTLCYWSVLTFVLFESIIQKVVLGRSCYQSRRRRSTCQWPDDNLIGKYFSGLQKRIECLNTEAERCVLFLVRFRLLEDWPALAALTNTIGHSSTSFCPLCIFPRSKGTVAASIVYTTKTHSRRLLLIRFNAIMYTAHSHGVLSEAFRKNFLIKDNTWSMTATYFTQKLSHELSSRSHKALTETSPCLLPNMCPFYSFLSAVAAQYTSSPD